MSLPSLVAHNVLYHPSEFAARDFKHIHRVVERRVFGHILIFDDGTHGFFAYRAGAHEHYIEARFVLDDIGVEVAHLRLLYAARMRELACERSDEAVIFRVRLAFIPVDYHIDDGVGRSGALVYRLQSPFPFYNAFFDVVVNDIESAYLPRAGARLHYRHAVDDLRLLHERMGVTADYHIDAPVGIEERRELSVLFYAYVRQKNEHIRVLGAVVVGYYTDLLRRLLDVYVRAYDALAFGGAYDLLRQKTDEHYPHTVYIYIQIRLEKAGIVQRYEQVGVYYREFSALFEKQQMRYAVIYLVVAYRCDVGRKRVHHIYGRQPHEFRIYNGAAEHIAGVCEDNVFLLRAHFFNVARQS